MPSGEKRKEKTTPFGGNLMRSQVLYRAAQVPSGDMYKVSKLLAARRLLPGGAQMMVGIHPLHQCKHWDASKAS